MTGEQHPERTLRDWKAMPTHSPLELKEGPPELPAEAQPAHFCHCSLKALYGCSMHAGSSPRGLHMAGCVRADSNQAGHASTITLAG